MQQDLAHKHQPTLEGTHDCVPEQYHVAIVLGKKLIHDQITVEYASRVRALLEFIKEKNEAVVLIFFTGGKQHGGFASEAVAGYTYFRQLCGQSMTVDSTSFEYYLDEDATNTIQNIHNVVAEVRRRLRDTNKQCHCTLVSNDYHVKRLKEIHKETPEQSLLKELEETGTVDFVEAPYPFLNSSDPVTRWFGKINLLRDELACVRANLEGILNGRESALSDGNLCTLERVIKELQGCCSSAPQAVENSTVTNVRTMMEKCALPQLIQCQDALHRSVPNASYHVTVKQALDCFLQAHRIIRSDANPDRPLKWGE
jgi:hypothetical protein